MSTSAACVLSQKDASAVADSALVAFLQLTTIPLSLSSKAPQIITNYRHRSTGNLSAFAVFNALLGCVARLFTTNQEVNDPLIFWGFAGATVLNFVLAGQMIQYWKQSQADVAALPERASEKSFTMTEDLPIDSPAERRHSRKID